MRNPHAGVPFTESDAAIAAALQDVSVPALLMSCVHMTDDDAVRRSILDGPLTTGRAVPQRGAGLHVRGGQGRGPRLALGIIADYRDRGCPEPEPVDAATLHRMMNWIAAAEVPDEYVPMMLEEMDLDGADAREEPLRQRSGGAPRLPVLVIGAGQSGILAAIRLQQAGIPFTVDREESGRRRNLVGEQLSRRAGRRRQSLLLLQLRTGRSLDRVLRPPTRTAGLLRRRDATPRPRRAHPVRHRGHLRGVGRRHRHLGGHVSRPRRRPGDAARQRGHQRRRSTQPPFLPDLPGADTSPDRAFHTARWDHGVDLSGKDVVMIGAGATGFQLAPAIADTVEVG